MIKAKVIVKNKTGMHARPVSELVKITNKYKSDIQMIVGEKKTNAKSMLAIMSTGIKNNTSIEIQCEGEDEKEALKEIIAAFENKFGE